MATKQSKIKYLVKLEYENGDVWVLIRNWAENEWQSFYDEERTHNPKIKALALMPLDEFDKDDNTGRWWNVARVK